MDIIWLENNVILILRHCAGTRQHRNHYKNYILHCHFEFVLQGRCKPRAIKLA